MIVLSLFDYTGIMVKPWAEAGYECICVDIQHPAEGRSDGNTSFIRLDLSGRSSDWELLAESFAGQEVIIFCFAECTELTLSGAKHWEAKRAANPAFQHQAIQPMLNTEELANKLNAPYMIENPRGMLSKLWRKEDYTFDPKDFGGYLPIDDEHPTYPDIIPPRDAYSKLTCIWAGNGFKFPVKSPVQEEFKLYRKGNGELLKVSKIVAKTGGSSLKTKNIRSATPRGYALATFLANRK